MWGFFYTYIIFSSLFIQSSHFFRVILPTISHTTKDAK